MQEDCGNIYRNARKTAGLTQERWAELIGVSVEAVRQYEGGIILPGDEVAVRMAEGCGQHIVCYWHLLNKSRAATELLPEVRHRRLPEAVLTLLGQVKTFQGDGLEELLRIAADGRVAEDERERYAAALRQLRELITAAWELQFAEETNNGPMRASAPTK